MNGKQHGTITDGFACRRARRTGRCAPVAENEVAVCDYLDPLVDEQGVPHPASGPVSIELWCEIKNRITRLTRTRPDAYVVAGACANPLVAEGICVGVCTPAGRGDRRG